MEFRKRDRHVIPTMDLLAEMETLEIHGGIGGGQVDPNDTKYFCNGAKCACGTTELKTDKSCENIFFFCGDDTKCAGCSA